MARVTRAEAARELEIDKSTLTRWIQKHPALLGDDGMVDVDELRSHRDAVANPKLQTRGKAAGGAASQAKAASAPSALNDHRARGEFAKAIQQELDLAERLKLTLVRQDVERQISEAGDLLKREAARLSKDRAEMFARIDDPRQMERALDDLMRQLLEAGATALIVALSRDIDRTDAA